MVDGKELRRCCSSWSVVLVGTRRPWRFPVQRRPIMRVPEMVVWISGVEGSSASNVL